MNIKKSGKKKRKGNIFFWAILLFVSTFSLLGYLFLNNIKGDHNSFCANSISCINNLSGKEENTEQAQFMGKAIKVPKLMYEDKKYASVLSGSTGEQKRIYVNLSNQTLYAFEGDKKIYEFPVSTGKWALTPTGEFYIWIKLRATLMQGGNKEIGTYYYLPNVPYTMYFYNEDTPKTRGYGVHGAYWHNNFGHPMSHGCINVKPENAKLLYDWADPPTNGYTTYATSESPGTKIIIFGETPLE